MNRVLFLSLGVLLIADLICPTGLLSAAPVKLNGPLALGGDVAISSLQFSPDGGKVLYLAEQDTAGVTEAYVISLAGGAPTKVNSPLVNGGDVSLAVFSPDGSWVVYNADQDIDEARELYSVASGGGPSTKLNTSLPANRGVGAPKIFAGSNRVVYSVDQSATQVFDVFSVPISGGVSVKMNGPLVAGGDAALFDVSSIAGKVFYLADQDVDNVQELFVVPASGGSPLKLNGPMTPGGTINAKGVAISPDGSRAVYLANQLVNDVFELFSAPSAGGAAVRLNSSLVNGGDVLQSSIFISPNSTRVIFRADGDTDGVAELYSVLIAGGSQTKLNGSLPFGGMVLEPSLQFSSDSSHVLYLADGETDNVNEIYVVPSAGGEPLKLNGSLVNGGDVASAIFSPDGSRVVFRADADSDEVFELYSVATSGGPVVKLNGMLTASGDVTSFQFTPDGSRVVFLADEDSNDVAELYDVAVSGGAVEKLSGALVNGGDVTTFLISPNSHRVVYRADQDTDEVFEIYSVDLPGGLLGDFDQNGIVDAADYTVWRDGLGSKYTPDDYGVWKSHFGEHTGSGVGGRGDGNRSFALIPEPNAWALIVCALMISDLRRRR